MMVWSNFLKFFAIFLEFSIWGRVGTHWNNSFLFSLFLGLSRTVLAWKEAMMVFSNFLNFFAIFFEFSMTGRVGTYRNDFFYFPLSRPFPTYFCLKRSCDGLSQFFEFFCYFFLIFYYGSARNTSERFFLFSLFLRLSPPILAWKEAMMVFSNFLKFYRIFYYESGRNTLEQIIYLFFLFSLFLDLSQPIWLGKKLWWCFLICWIFLQFFFNFLLQVRLGTHRNIFF